MRVVNWLIAQATLLAVSLSLSLSGFGMAQAHTAMVLDGSVDHSMHAGMDHAGMDHAGHDMTASDQGTAHEGHASCPMMGCCHTGAVATPSIPAMIEGVTCQHTLSFDLHVTNAEPESAKKPPKHA